MRALPWDVDSIVSFLLLLESSIYMYPYPRTSVQRGMKILNQTEVF
jgi:hypothetical protein